MQPDYGINFSYADRIHSMLGPGESLTWSGRPDAKKLLLITVPLMLFGAYWAYSHGSSLYRITGGQVPELDDPQLFVLIIQALFTLAGLVMFIGAYWFYNRVKGIFYAITDRRFLVLDGSTEHSFTAEQLVRLSGRMKRTDVSEVRTSEDIRLTEGVSGKSGLGKLTIAALLTGFFALPNFKQVADMLQNIKQPTENEREG